MVLNMILDMCLYFSVFVLASFLIGFFQYFYNTAIVKLNYKKHVHIGSFSYCIIGVFFLLPIIAMYGLRYGIGSDYFNYETIFNTVHDAPLSQYLSNHNGDYRSSYFFYVEFLYYVLNRLFPSYRLLLWGIGVILFSLLLISLKEYSKSLSFPFAVFIYLTTQFFFSLNVMRFSIAVVLILIGYTYLAKNKTKSFIVLVLVAALFHKTSILCLAFIFVKEFKYKGPNRFRNAILFISIISVPLIGNYVIKVLSHVALFKRYFSIAQYTVSESISSSWMWILHVVPVVLPLLILCRNELFNDYESKIYFRICVLEIPFRMIGLYNNLYTRFARFSQIIQVILIPLVISRVKEKNKKIVLYVYYIVWFVFYCAYYAIINDNCDSLPYVWILSQ